MELVDAMEVEDPELNATAPQVLWTHAPALRPPLLERLCTPTVFLWVEVAAARASCTGFVQGSKPPSESHCRLQLRVRPVLPAHACKALGAQQRQLDARQPLHRTVCTGPAQGFTGGCIPVGVTFLPPARWHGVGSVQARCAPPMRYGGCTRPRGVANDTRMPPMPP